MGVVSISSSATRSPVGLSSNLLSHRSSTRRPLILAFKGDKSSNTALILPRERILLPVERGNGTRKRQRKTNKSDDAKAVSADEACSSALEVDYNEAAAKLESIYKRSPATEKPVREKMDGGVQTPQRMRKRKMESDDKTDSMTSKVLVRNRAKKTKRLSLDKRIALRKNVGEKSLTLAAKKKDKLYENENIERLVRDYSSTTDLVSLDWKKMKIPAVLSSNKHAWLFKLMQPMKGLIQLKGVLEKNLGREPTEGELAAAANMSVVEAKKHLEIGRAARNKLIKHNLRLVLFVMNKYFQDFTNGPRFQDLCQAGVKGLITAIDRFEPRRRFRLSTYGLFWIRHAIIRSMTTSSFTRVPFGLESVRVDIQRAKLQLLFELGRMPTENEIAERVGISLERYNGVMKASKPVVSLNSRHSVTQEELISGIKDVDGVGADNRRQPALLRLALDDVLDSLKPKESLVIRQRYGLDGKGDRTLGEIAGNLNISREMVRKHEVKALMKLKHPARVDYLRRYIV